MPTKTQVPELPAGRIAGCFGVHGELKCDPTTAARSLFVVNAEFGFKSRTHEGKLRIESVREHQRRLLVRFHGITNRNEAQTLVGATLFARKEQLKLEAGEFLDADLIGCNVTGIDGRHWGAVERVEHYPASDILVVNGRMLPMVGAIVRSIDVTSRKIVVDPPAGLLEG